MPATLDLLAALRSGPPVVAVELRPPRAELAEREGMDAWIDTYHAVRRLTRQDRFVFLTDSAVGAEEEDNLRHLVTNLGLDVPRARVVPFLTTKHPLDYCLSYAERAHQQGFPALVVLGGDRTIGTPRCVEHAWQLRRLIRARDHTLALGGWANPQADSERQIEYLSAGQFTAEFFLTQIVSHHRLRLVERFLATAARQRLDLPGVFGVFYYRSANPKTLSTLGKFLPVPAEELTREFAMGVSPEEVCARTITALRQVGARHVYISNLPLATAHGVLAHILSLAGG
jgi:5,10-methylenetetrahydrofolate reductase